MMCRHCPLLALQTLLWVGLTRRDCLLAAVPCRPPGQGGRYICFRYPCPATQQLFSGFLNPAATFALGLLSVGPLFRRRVSNHFALISPFTSYVGLIGCVGPTFSGPTVSTFFVVRLLSPHGQPLSTGSFSLVPPLTLRHRCDPSSHLCSASTRYSP